MSRRRAGRGRAWILVALWPAAHGLGQSLEPRAYSPSPTGANFAIGALSHQDGSVLLDPSLPVTDVTAKLNVASLSYAHTFGLFGRSASVGLLVPYVGARRPGRSTSSSAR